MSYPPEIDMLIEAGVSPDVIDDEYSPLEREHAVSLLALLTIRAVQQKDPVEAALAQDIIDTWLSYHPECALSKGTA